MALPAAEVEVVGEGAVAFADSSLVEEVAWLVAVCSPLGMGRSIARQSHPHPNRAKYAYDAKYPHQTDRLLAVITIGRRREEEDTSIQLTKRNEEHLPVSFWHSDKDSRSTQQSCY